MSHQRPFSHFRRFKPRSTLFEDVSPDSNDMFGFDDPSWTFPRTSSRFGSSSFDSPRSNMRPAFRSRNLDDEPFFRNRRWMDDDDEPRMSRGYSPDSRHSPTPQAESPGSQSFFRSMDANGGIPTRVKHEGSSRSSTPSNEDINEPESPVPVPGVEKHPGVTSKVNSGNPQTAKRQPKVHHIPIRVEARDEEMSGQQQDATTHRKATFKPPSPQPSPQMQQPQSPKTVPRKGKSTVHIIPTQVNGDAKEASKPEAKPVTPPSSAAKSTQMIVIETTLLDLERLKPQVEKFKGTRADKEYLFLDEMLTRHLIKLDDIVVEGNNELRQARKTAIKRVNDCIHVLEANVVITQEEGVERKDENVEINQENTQSNQMECDSEAEKGAENSAEASGEQIGSSANSEAGQENVQRNETENEKCMDLTDKPESNKGDVDMENSSMESTEQDKMDSKVDDENEPKTFTTTLSLQIT
uniref:BAG domain-containing protein n=1 Tax=Strigamia maritima TaxID=126957 RepID=T1J5M6_STRMM